MKWKIAAIVASLAFFVLLASIFLFAGLRAVFGLHPLGAPAVVTQVKALKQLVTVRYTVQRVVGLRESKQPLGEESILLIVQGEALAGLDLDNLRAADVRYTSERKVAIVLPPSRLLNVYLDEKQTQVWDRQITWWTPWVAPDLDLEHKARLQGVEEVRKAALSMGILDQAQRNAETAIRDLLAGFGMQASFTTQPLD